MCPPFPTTPAEPDRPAAPGRAPLPSSVVVRDRFRRQKTRDTAPELALRREVHAQGLRYRVDVAPLPGLRRSADLVFPRARIAVFVDGCFWHSCPRHATAPKANAQWWQHKLERTVQRDRETDRALTSAGWAVVRVWEHEAPDQAAQRVLAAWAARRGPLTSDPSRVLPMDGNSDTADPPVPAGD